MINRLNTRPPLDRMLRIFEEISSGSYPGREQLAADIEVTTKTIQRDLDFMRDRLSVPIGYDRDRRGYHFTAPVSTFPFVELTESEIVSVFIAQKALQAHKGTSFEQPLRSAYSKLVSGLNGRISVPWADLGTSVSFRTYQSSSVEMETFDAVGQGVRNSSVLNFEYKKLGDSGYRPRTVEPYHLACVQGQWYCIALDRERDDWRNFVLSRMRNAKPQTERFLRDQPFDIDTYLQKSLGIFTGYEAHEIKLEFDVWAAQLIRERSWHPAQKINELTDGRLEFTLELSSLEEIMPWILSWGEHVRVLEPAALRTQLRETLTKMQAGL